VKNDQQLSFIDYQYVTYLWQEVYGEPLFRIQTNDPAIRNKLKKNKDVIPVGEGMNSSIWVFKITFDSPGQAPEFLKKLTSLKIRKTDDRHGYIAGHGAIARLNV